MSHYPPLAAMLILLTVAAPALRAQPEEPPSPDAADAMRSLFETTESVKAIGPWEDEYTNIAAALRTVWEQNGWNDEADLYARDLALDVSKIPPWEFTKRLELVSNRVKDRYSFSPAEAQRFQGLITRELFGFMIRHAPLIASQAREMVETRSKRQPFTSDQIARWVRDSEPLMGEIRERIATLNKEIRSGMNPEQQAIYDRDFASFSKRFDRYQEQRKVWAKGGWKPDHWGLQNDPIHRQAVAGASEAPATGPAETAPVPVVAAPAPAGAVAVVTVALPTRWVSHDPTTWIAYVLDRGQKLGFDQAQRNSAVTIHEELLLRADKYMAKRKEALAAVAESARSSDPLYHPVRTMFEELVRRLDALATTAQREQAPR